MAKQPLIVSSLDKSRLQPLIDSARLDRRVSLENLIVLEQELARATVLPPEEVPADVVRMNSLVTFVDLATGEEEAYTLVYPNEADLLQDRISVFAPIGTALLGYRAGDVIEWTVPAGKRRLRITRVETESELVASQ